MIRFRNIGVLVAILGLSAMAHSQQTIPFSGMVRDAVTLVPVASHSVYVSANDSLFIQEYMTDSNGMFSDSIFLAGTYISSLNFMTLDCQGQPTDTTVTSFNQMVIITLDICTDSTGADCSADFDYSTNPVNQMEVSFTNLSAGTFTGQQWDFGDGSYSGEFNPVHQYASPGDYEVCLTIFNADSLSPCTDIFCQTLSIGVMIPCHASFTWELDSLSLEPNTFLFHDQSTGDIDSWSWDFGDGTFASEQHPVHHYADSGQYLVCLSVYKASNPNQCGDTQCKTILPGEYFNFGGLVWEDEYPLNNPVFSNDTGIVFLYKLNQGKLHFMDSKIFWENGYYWFTDMLQGDYIVKVALTHGSASYGSYLPTYYGDHAGWEAAALISLEGDVFENHIHLVPSQVLDPGPGIINGYLSYEGNIPSGLEQQINITLSDENDEPLQFTEPSPNGAFTFSSLPFGSYIVRADLAGRPSEPQLISLSSSSPISSQVQLYINEAAFYDVPENRPETLAGAKVYPNPAHDWLNIDLEMKANSRVSLTLSDVTGKTLLRRDFNLLQGKETLRLDVSSLPQGIYIIKIKPSGGMTPIIRKFIK